MKKTLALLTALLLPVVAFAHNEPSRDRRIAWNPGVVDPNPNPPAIPPNDRSCGAYPAPPMPGGDTLTMDLGEFELVIKTSEPNVVINVGSPYDSFVSIPRTGTAKKPFAWILFAKDGTVISRHEASGFERSYDIAPRHGYRGFLNATTPRGAMFLFVVTAWTAVVAFPGPVAKPTDAPILMILNRWE